MKNLPAPLPDAETIDFSLVSDLFRSGEIDLVCVLGPTASGKTRYAVALARAIGGEIISADSRQVYRGMDIGTGKDLSEYGEVPYHLIDIADPGDRYNVARFSADFYAAKADIASRGRIPVLCGGTGLYINAVTCGSYDFGVDGAGFGAAGSSGDGFGAAVSSGDGSSGAGSSKPLSAAEGSDYSGTYFIGTLVSREVRNLRIDARLESRLSEGMVEEIDGLLKSGVSPEILISYGLEYKFVTLYLQGALSFDEMKAGLGTAIHQFAKRQMTWFRGMERAGARIHWTEV